MKPGGAFDWRGRFGAGVLAVLAGMPGIFGSGAVAGDLPGGPPVKEVVPMDVGLDSVAEFSTEVTRDLGLFLAGGLVTKPGDMGLARASLGALSGRGLTEPWQMKIPGSPAALQVPEVFSVVMWVRIEAGQKSSLLCGFGEPDGDYFVAATVSSGVPVLAFLNREKVSQISRASIAPINLADSRLHSVVVVVNLGSGLVRLYVDGRAEAVSTISFWRPRDFGLAFASYSLQGQTGIPGMVGLLMPRIICRGLTEEEISRIRPQRDRFDLEMAGIDPEMAVKLVRDTLVEFWPAGYGYLLRKRPL